MIRFSEIKSEVTRVQATKTSGKVISVNGPVIRASIPQIALTDICKISKRDGTFLLAEVVAFDRDEACLAPFDNVAGLSPGALVENCHSQMKIDVGEHLLGCIVSATGEILQAPAFKLESAPYTQCCINNNSPSPLERKLIKEPMPTGVKSIDAFCTLGYGQRIGLFASAGVGKSTLLGMIARNAKVDVVVIALVGERGREVREFLEDCLGTDGRKRSVVVVSTSDEAAIRRALATETATTIAEYFRANGNNVLLLIDSLTRTARAIRDVSLAAGEMPIRQGYTPSVYSKLPRLLERAGNNSSGSISAIYTVLTNGEGEHDPLGEEIKSILDGHIVLDPNIAAQGIRPAIDVTSSISRLFSRIHTKEYISSSNKLRESIARLKRDRDIMLLGGQPDSGLVKALELEPRLKDLLNQSAESYVNFDDTLSQVSKLADY